MSRLILPILPLLVLLSLPARADTDPVVAQQGSVSLTASAVRDLIAALDPEQQDKLHADPRALANFVRDRLLQAALLGEARAKQWDNRPEIVTRATQAHDSVIADTYLASLVQPPGSFPTDADIQAAYEANKAKLLIPRRYHLAQIFVAVPSGASSAADTAAKSRAAALRPLWEKTPGNPAAAVKAAGDDHAVPAIATDLGWILEDQIADPIRPTVAGMTDGAISQPIRVSDGWHLVRMIETKAASPAALSDVREVLIRALRQAKQQQNARAYLDALMQKTPIQLNEIALSQLVGKDPR